MRRREFMATAVGAALWRRTAFAQQSRTAVIGILVPGNLDPQRFVNIFKDELSRLGYVEGQNLRLEFRSGGGRDDVLAKLAAELVQINVDVIVTWLTPAVRAAKQATD